MREQEFLLASNSICREVPRERSVQIDGPGRVRMGKRVREERNGERKKGGRGKQEGGREGGVGDLETEEPAAQQRSGHFLLLESPAERSFYTYTDRTF